MGREKLNDEIITKVQSVVAQASLENFKWDALCAVRHELTALGMSEKEAKDESYAYLEPLVAGKFSEEAIIDHLVVKFRSRANLGPEHFKSLQISDVEKYMDRYFPFIAFDKVLKISLQVMIALGK